MSGTRSNGSTASHDAPSQPYSAIPAARAAAPSSRSQVRVDAGAAPSRASSLVVVIDIVVTVIVESLPLLDRRTIPDPDGYIV